MITQQKRYLKKINLIKSYSGTPLSSHCPVFDPVHISLFLLLNLDGNKRPLSVGHTRGIKDGAEKQKNFMFNSRGRIRSQSRWKQPLSNTSDAVSIQWDRIDCVHLLITLHSRFEWHLVHRCNATSFKVFSISAGKYMSVLACISYVCGHLLV